VVALLADYLEERLQPQQHAELTSHLDDCQTCVAQLHTYRSTVSLLRSLKRMTFRRTSGAPCVCSW
jgi:anti-sigma factor RsiW